MANQYSQRVANAKPAQRLPESNGIYQMDGAAVSVLFCTPDSFEIHALSGEYLGYFEIYRPKQWQSGTNPYIWRGFDGKGMPIAKSELRKQDFIKM